LICKIKRRKKNCCCFVCSVSLLLFVRCVALFCNTQLGCRVLAVQVKKKKKLLPLPLFFSALAVARRFSFVLSPSTVAVWDGVSFRSTIRLCADYAMSGAFQWHQLLRLGSSLCMRGLRLWEFLSGDTLPTSSCCSFPAYYSR